MIDNNKLHKLNNKLNILEWAKLRRQDEFELYQLYDDSNNFHSYMAYDLLVIKIERGDFNDK